MELLSTAVAADLPPLYATEHEADPICRVKLFTPDAGYTPYVTEFDPSERLFFGYVLNGWDGELGYMSLDELERWAGRSACLLSETSGLPLCGCRRCEGRRTAPNDAAGTDFAREGMGHRRAGPTAMSRRCGARG